MYLFSNYIELETSYSIHVVGGLKSSTDLSIIIQQLYGFRIHVFAIMSTTTIPADQNNSQATDTFLPIPFY